MTGSRSYTVMGIDPGISPTYAVVVGSGPEDVVLERIYDGHETTCQERRVRGLEYTRLPVKLPSVAIRDKIGQGKRRRKHRYGPRKAPFPLYLKEILRWHGPDLVVIENAWVLPGQGLASSAAFVGAARLMEGIVHGMDIPLLVATPRAWRFYCGVTADPLEDLPFEPQPEAGRNDESPTGHPTRYHLNKERSRMRAMQLAPESADLFRRKKDHDRAEAFLMAVYGLGLLHQFKGKTTAVIRRGFTHRKNENRLELGGRKTAT